MLLMLPASETTSGNLKEGLFGCGNKTMELSPQGYLSVPFYQYLLPTDENFSVYCFFYDLSSCSMFLYVCFSFNSFYDFNAF